MDRPRCCLCRASLTLPPGIIALSLIWDEVEEKGILWYYFGHCNSVCKIRGKGVYLLSFHGVNVCLNL